MQCQEKPRSEVTYQIGNGGSSRRRKLWSGAKIGGGSPVGEKRRCESLVKKERYRGRGKVQLLSKLGEVDKKEEAVDGFCCCDTGRARLERCWAQLCGLVTFHFGC